MSRRSVTYADQKVSTPAIALIVVTALWLCLGTLATLFDVVLLLSGEAKPLHQGRGNLVVGGRMVLTVVILAYNLVILAGAVQMKRLRAYRFAKAACWMAVNPCMGPCYLLGIPFGVWGIGVLNDPRVRRGFDTAESHWSREDDEGDEDDGR